MMNLYPSDQNADVFYYESFATWANRNIDGHILSHYVAWFQLIGISVVIEAAIFILIAVVYLAIDRIFNHSDEPYFVTIASWFNIIS